MHFKQTALLLALAGQLQLSAYAQAPVNNAVVGQTLATSRESPWQPVKPPNNAPNVVWILLDDVGFGASSAFGGLINTPVLDSLGRNGLSYTNFHTAGICAPTRAALLTGRNHHAVHEGGFSHTMMSFGFPGYDGHIPASSGTAAEILKQAGYNTFAVGKWGVTPDTDTSDAGPFNYWPTGKGFEQFFGFLGSETDQYRPSLVEDQHIAITDGRHLGEQITDKAIDYIKRQKKAAPGKPFFLYYTPAGTHAPHQVTEEWSNPYKGKFDAGWDDYREKVLARQKSLGIVPANAVLPERDSLITAWNSLPDEQKKLNARFMEVYAGYLTYTDFQIGRIVNYLKETGQLNNTLIVAMIGDNGASKEGFYYGVDGPHRAAVMTSEQDYIQSTLAHIKDIGHPDSWDNFPMGWAQATNTPFKQWKSDANSEGGNRNPLILFYPNGIQQKGGWRDQYSFITDILPTTLEITGIQHPAHINGVAQDSLQGYSLGYSFNNPKATAIHNEQYYYIFGSRSIYADGWKAEALHRPNHIDLLYFPRRAQLQKPDFEKDRWELYDMTKDFNERVDLAQKHPEKLKELKALFDKRAKENNVYPLIDWSDVINRAMRQLQSRPGTQASK